MSYNQTQHFISIVNDFTHEGNMLVNNEMLKYKNGLYFGLEDFESINVHEDISNIDIKASYLYTSILFAHPENAYRYLHRLKEIIDDLGFYNYHFQLLPPLNKLGDRIAAYTEYNCPGSTHKFFEPDFVEFILYDMDDLTSEEPNYYHFKYFLFHPDSRLQIIPDSEVNLIDEAKNRSGVTIFTSL